MSNALANINCGVPAGITKDQLYSDIKMLLDNGYVDIKTLTNWAEKIDAVTLALSDLDSLTGKHMPEKTSGHCHDLQITGKNDLLTMIMNISYSQSQFVGEVQQVKTRVLKILSERERLNDL